MSTYGVIISSENYSGQTALVNFLDTSNGTTYDLGYKTIPFEYTSVDGSTQGLFFLYFSATNITCIVDTNQPDPSPTPTLTPSQTPTVTPTPSQTPTQTSSETPTPTPTVTSTLL